MKNFEILLIGSNGFLGSEIAKELKKKKINYITIARSNSDYNLNLNNFFKINKYLSKKKIQKVINCAGIIDFDKCERNFKQILKINYQLPKFLSKMSIKYNFRFIHISTDHVYNGNKKKIHSENDKVFGINKYAKSKILAEKAVRLNKKNLIIRTNFTGRKKNKKISFLDSVILNLKKKHKISLFNDMYTSTIDVKTCATLIVKLILLNASGIYNIGSKDVISKQDFIINFAKRMKKKLNFDSVSSDVLKVKRGKNLGMNVTKIENKLNIKMPTSKKVINNLVKEYI